MQQRGFEGDKIRVGGIARALKGDAKDGPDARGALREQIDSVGKLERLLNVVGDKERRLGKPSPCFQEPVVKLRSCEGIERPEGFIEQENLSVRQERADERDALAHPRGELGRVYALKAGKPKLLKEPSCALLRVLPIFSDDLRAKQCIGERRAPGQQQIFLLHICDMTPTVADRSAVEEDHSRIGTDQPGDDVQERCFPAAAWAYQSDQFPVLDFQIYLVEHGQGQPIAWETLRDLNKLKMSHMSSC